MKGEIDVEFPIRRNRLLNSPTPIAFKIMQHLLNFCVAAGLLGTTWKPPEGMLRLRGLSLLNGDTDFASFLRSRLASF